MKKLNKIAKRIKKANLEQDYKKFFVDWIKSDDFPSLSQTYLEDLCFDKEAQDLTKDLKVNEEVYFSSEHSLYYDTVKDYELGLTGKTHIDYSIECIKLDDGTFEIYLDVYPEMKTDDGITLVLEEGFTVYGNSNDFATMAKEAKNEIYRINIDWVDVF